MPPDLAAFIADTLNKIYQEDADADPDYAKRITASDVDDTYRLWYRFMKGFTETGTLPPPVPYSRVIPKPVRRRGMYHRRRTRCSSRPQQSRTTMMTRSATHEVGTQNQARHHDGKGHGEVVQRYQGLRFYPARWRLQGRLRPHLRPRARRAHRTR